MTRTLFFIACAGFAMPVWADEKVTVKVNIRAYVYPLASYDCNKEWVEECVGSDQDKYRDWKPPKMYTAQEQQAIMERGSHICEYSSTGDCARVQKRVVGRDEGYE